MIKKIVFITSILLISFCSCERDDICLDGATPNLIIRFLNNDESGTPKKVLLTVFSEAALGENKNIYFEESLDSISLPLNITEEFTKYSFISTVSGEEKTDTFEFSYDKNAKKFISRSCGFITTFENFEIQPPTEYSWITSYKLNTTTIENDFTTHLFIFH